MNIKFRLLIIMISALFTGCGGEEDPFKAVNFDTGLNQRIEQYHTFIFPDSETVNSGNPKVYIDFSNGLHQAYTDYSDNRDLTQWITQTLSAESNIEWFKVANSTIEAMDFNPKELYNKIVEPKSYSKDIMAPIEKAVREITTSANDALLITDFEEFELDNQTKRGTEQFQNFAKVYFEDWLSKGNSITFFITDFNEKAKGGRTVSKYLYYIIFTYGNQSSSSILTKIEYALKGRSFAPERFDLTNVPYTLTTNYGTDRTGGIFYDLENKNEKNRNVLDLKKDSYLIRSAANHPFEFYEFGVDWKTIEELKANYQQQNAFTYFFKNLFIDLKNEDTYTIDAVEVKVYDITDDFLFFAKSREVLNHKPKLVKDSNGENKLDPAETDAVALTCYDEKGIVKEEWVYSHKVSEPLSGLFILNQKLFENTKKADPSKTELEVQFHDKFTVNNIPNPSGLMRVDIVITKVTPNLSNSKLDQFKWDSTTKKGETNQALYESIRNTIGSEHIKPKNRVIYSYYIKTL